MGMPSKTLHNFVIRPATLDDLESVLHLITVQNTADYDSPMISENSLRKAWQSPGCDVATSTWLVTAPDGQLAGYAELQQEADTEFYHSIYVAVEYRNQRIGTTLLNLVEARAATNRSAETAFGLTTRVSERNTAARYILERAGYSRTLSFSLMEIVMMGPPASPQWVNGITIRTFITGQDEQTTYLADEEASEDKGYHAPLKFEAWADRMNLHGESFDPTLWHLACDENEIVGVALNVYSQATHTGWVDHLGVRRKWRNKGLGKALLLHSFGEFYRRGIPRVKLSVDSHSLTNAPRLYEQAGMRTIQQYHIYKKELY